MGLTMRKHIFLFCHLLYSILFIYFFGFREDIRDYEVLNALVIYGILIIWNTVYECARLSWPSQEENIRLKKLVSTLSNQNRWMSQALEHGSDRYQHEVLEEFKKQENSKES